MINSFNLFIANGHTFPYVFVKTHKVGKCGHWFRGRTLEQSTAVIETIQKGIVVIISSAFRAAFHNILFCKPNLFHQFFELRLVANPVQVRVYIDIQSKNRSLFNQHFCSFYCLFVLSKQ